MLGVLRQSRPIQSWLKTSDSIGSRSSTSEREKMEIPARKCQVVMRKINLGEKATMHRCVVPIKRLQISQRTFLKPRQGNKKLSHVQFQNLKVLLQKLKLSKDRVDGSTVVQGDGGSREELMERTLSTVQLRKLRVLLNKLKPNSNKWDGSVTPFDRENKENQEEPVKRSLSNLQLHKFKLLLSKVKLTKDGAIAVQENREEIAERTLSQVQLHKFKVLLSKLKLSNDRQDLSIIIDEGCGIVTCPRSLTVVNKKRFRILLRRLKLNNILDGHDHTLFIDKKLGFVTNPYLLPSYPRGPIRKPHHSVLKFRRSRARQCHVRIKKIHL